MECLYGILPGEGEEKKGGSTSIAFEVERGVLYVEGDRKRRACNAPNEPYVLRCTELEKEKSHASKRTRGKNVLSPRGKVGS